MISVTDKRVGWALGVAFAVASIGCGAEPIVGGSSSDLLMPDELGRVDSESWSAADAGCEGHLVGDVRFAIASADGGLVAAVDGEGTVLCVDTVDAVEEELEDIGRTEEADGLVDAYWATIARAAEAEGARCAFDQPNREGDPQPEPSMGGIRMQADPQPEPNMGGRP